MCAWQIIRNALVCCLRALLRFLDCLVLSIATWRADTRMHSPVCPLATDIPSTCISFAGIDV